MLLTRAREPARTGERGELIPLAEQDRALWRAEDIAEGVAILERVLPRGPVGRFQLQAAIAAVHAEAAAYEDTDWEQILVLYDMLEEQAPSPAVTLNRAVAVGMARGPEQGLAIVDDLLARPAAWPATTARTPSARTCSSWPATPPKRRASTPGPPA